MIDIYILKCILDNQIYKKFNYLLEDRFLKDESEELALIYSSIKDFHEKNQDSSISSIEDLELHFYSCYPALPKKKRALYAPIFDRLRSSQVDPSKVEVYLSEFEKKFRLRKLAETCIYAAQGKDGYDLEKVKEVYGTLDTDSLHSGRRSSRLWNNLVSLESLGSTGREVSREIHLPYRCLQVSLGPLRKGDFGVVLARPEVGKTSLVCHITTYAIPQVETCIVYLGNEERAEAVLKRLVSSVLGQSVRELSISELILAEKKAFGDKLKFVHEPNLHRKEFHAFLRDVSPSLVIIDQLSKVNGFDEERYDLELGKKFQWGRQLASEFCPVIGVNQASESAEGKRWLDMGDIANSKTSIPAEADWILGIGKEHNEAMKHIRHFHLMKNKLEGDENTIEEYRHGKFDMIIRPEMCRYEDTMKL